VHKPLSYIKYLLLKYKIRYGQFWYSKSLPNHLNKTLYANETTNETVVPRAGLRKTQKHSQIVQSLMFYRQIRFNFAEQEGFFVLAGLWPASKIEIKIHLLFVLFCFLKPKWHMSTLSSNILKWGKQGYQNHCIKLRSPQIEAEPHPLFTQKQKLANITLYDFPPHPNKIDSYAFLFLWMLDGLDIVFGWILKSSMIIYTLGLVWLGNINKKKKKVRLSKV